MAAAAEERARNNAVEVEKDSQSSLISLRVQLEKERREERKDLLQKAASEKIALEAKFKAEIERLRTDMKENIDHEHRAADARRKLELEKQTIEFERRMISEVESKKFELAEAQHELVKTKREIKDAHLQKDEYQKIIRETTERCRIMKTERDRSEHLLNAAQDTIEMLKKQISTLQMDLTGKDKAKNVVADTFCLPVFLLI